MAKKKLIDIMLGREFAISPQSFWQINRDTAEALYAKGRSCLLLTAEMFCLTFIAASAASGFRSLIKALVLFGVEVVFTKLLKMPFTTQSAMDFLMLHLFAVMLESVFLNAVKNSEALMP